MLPNPQTPSDGSHILRYERLRNGAFFADFRRDKRLYPEVYHCVIQRDGSKEILSWTQYKSLESAMSAAECELEGYCEEVKKKIRQC